MSEMLIYSTVTLNGRPEIQVSLGGNKTALLLNGNSVQWEYIMFFQHSRGSGVL